MTDRARVGARPVVDELCYKSEAVHVCLIVNRRQRTARVLDFLAGNFAQKSQALDVIARREGLARVFTLVEREESHGWARVGYAREGSVAGFYKRSDAYVMGRVVGAQPEALPEGGAQASYSDGALAERTLQAAKRLVDEVGEAPRGVRAGVLSDDELSAVLPKGRDGEAYLGDRFGRAGARLYVAARPARAGAGRASALVGAELQEPFGTAYVHLSGYPATAPEARVLVAALEALGAELKAREVGCAFGVSPATDALTTAAMLAAGYKKSGLLARHQRSVEGRVDSILWTRRALGHATDAHAA